MPTGKEHEVKGKLNKLKGSVKEGVGALIGDRSTEAEGKLERAKGAIQEKYGQVKSDLTDDTPTEPHRRP